MARSDILGLIVIAGCILFCLLGLLLGPSNTQDVLQWLPDGSIARQDYNEFDRKFGSDDFLIVTWNDCTIEDPRLQQFCQQLEEKDADGLIQSVFNGTDVIDKLESLFQLSKKVVVNRFRGIFFGIEDPNQTLALIELTQKGSTNRKKALRQIKQIVVDVPGLELDDVSFAGYPYVGISLDNQLKSSFRHLLLPSVLLASIVSFCCLRNFALSIIVFVSAVGASACSIAIIPILGVKFGGMMSIIPALVFILTTSGSIHLIRYSLAAIGDLKMLLRIGWQPCVVSAMTTAIGMLSLTRSSFPAIRRFGFFCATGVMFALAFQLVALPWLLQRFGAKGQHALAGRANRGQAWSTISSGILGHRLSIFCAGIALMIACAAGLSRLSARVAVEKLFDPDSAVLASLADLDSRIGPIDQSEFMVVFNDVDAENFHVRAKLVSRIQHYLSTLPSVGVTHSLHNYLPREPKQSRIQSAIARAVYRRQLKRQRQKLGKGPFLNVEPNSETWRIGLRFPFTSENDVEHQKERVLAAATELVDAFLMDEEKAAVVPRPRFVYTGKSYLFHTAQLTLLGDLFGNFLMAFVIITPVLIVVLRSLSLGLIAMLPNLFPVVVLFGMLGWLSWPVDLAIAMTACVALGIAVDDTTHFLIRFREFGGNLANIELPLKKTIVQCGPAMLHTTSIGAAGLIVYGCSGMPVIRNFCLSITSMLVLALVADIFLLPAILAFWQRKPRSED